MASISDGEKMITRTFLLLLALLSGLSVAQARDIVAADQDVAGWSAADTQNDIAAADFVRVAVVFARNAAHRIDRLLPELSRNFVASRFVISPFDPLSRSDRLLV